MARFGEVQAALDTRLSTLSGSTPVAWENIKYQPTEGTAFLRPTNLPADATSVGLENASTVRTLGFYQIDVFAPVGDGPGAALTLADSVAAHFAKGVQLTSGDTTVVLGVPAQQPANASGAWLQVAVLIPYEAFFKQ